MPRWVTDPRTILVLAAFAGVLIALIVADFATGGKAELTDLGLATPVTPLPTLPPSPTLPPGVTPSPTPSPTPDASGLARNQRRKEDMMRLADAFLRYARDHDGFPDTNNALQSICVYQELDKGCAIKEYLDPIPVDPKEPKDPLKNGYWWSSTSRALILYAINEGSTADSPQCPKERPPSLQKIKDGLTCVVVQAP